MDEPRFVGWHAGAVRIKGLVWLGVPTERYEQTVDFFHHALGMRVAFQEGTTVELAAQNGDKVQIFSPDNSYFEFFPGSTHRWLHCSKSTAWTMLAHTC
jgi:catechol 2,3-dioxygenase-like lactoylglutathione lyase family enzyme